MLRNKLRAMIGKRANKIDFVLASLGSHLVRRRLRSSLKSLQGAFPFEKAVMFVVSVTHIN